MKEAVACCTGEDHFFFISSRGFLEVSSFSCLAAIAMVKWASRFGKDLTHIINRVDFVSSDSKTKP